VTPDDVLSFWFGELGELGLASKAQAERWFRKDPTFDAEIRQRFAGLHSEIMAGTHEAWQDTAEGRLAYVIVLDQFSRNMFRDTPRMFASDERAVGATLQGLERGHDRVLPTHPRMFMYMPLMHSEALAMQDKCVATFTTLRDELLPGEARAFMDFAIGYANAHRDIIHRFARFPHRNSVLGRVSTPEELEFLTQPGSSF